MLPKWQLNNNDDDDDNNNNNNNNNYTCALQFPKNTFQSTRLLNWLADGTTVEYCE